MIRHVSVAIDDDLELAARTHGTDECVYAVVTNVVVAQVELVQRSVTRKNFCQMPACVRTLQYACVGMQRAISEET